MEGTKLYHASGPRRVQRSKVWALSLGCESFIYGLWQEKQVSWQQQRQLLEGHRFMLLRIWVASAGHRVSYWMWWGSLSGQGAAGVGKEGWVSAEGVRVKKLHFPQHCVMLCKQSGNLFFPRDLFRVFGDNSHRKWLIHNNAVVLNVCIYL